MKRWDRPLINHKYKVGAEAFCDVGYYTGNCGDVVFCEIDSCVELESGDIPRYKINIMDGAYSGKKLTVYETDFVDVVESYENDYTNKPDIHSKPISAPQNSVKEDPKDSQKKQAGFVCDISDMVTDISDLCININSLSNKPTNEAEKTVGSVSLKLTDIDPVLSEPVGVLTTNTYTDIADGGFDRLEEKVEKVSKIAKLSLLSKLINF
jgi:hypothetical protein